VLPVDGSLSPGPFVAPVISPWFTDGGWTVMTDCDYHVTVLIRFRTSRTPCPGGSRNPSRPGIAKDTGVAVARSLERKKGDRALQRWAKSQTTSAKSILVLPL
jgi:hypothetical protein